MIVKKKPVHVEGCTLEPIISGFEEELRNCKHDCEDCGWHEKIIAERKEDELILLPNGLRGYVTKRKKDSQK